MVPKNQNHTRRKVLKASAYGGAITGFTSNFAMKGMAKHNGDGQSPSAGSQPNLFRLIDSGFKKSQTVVRIYSVDDSQSSRDFNLSTTGTNHPEMDGKSHQERFPHVATDINSFGSLSPGTYTVRVEREGLVGETQFSAGEDGILDGNVIWARVMPNDELNVYTGHLDSQFSDS